MLTSVRSWGRTRLGCMGCRKDHPHPPRRIFDPPEADLRLSSASLRPWPHPVMGPLRNCISRLWCHPDHPTSAPAHTSSASARAAQAPPTVSMQRSRQGRGDGFLRGTGRVRGGRWVLGQVLDSSRQRRTYSAEPRNDTEKDVSGHGKPRPFRS